MTDKNPKVLNVKKVFNENSISFEENVLSWFEIVMDQVYNDVKDLPLAETEVAE